MGETVRTEAMGVRLVELVRKGMPKPAAAERMGISRHTFLRWRREDEAFNAKVIEAEAAYLETLVDRAQAIAADANDRMSANMIQFLLERRHPDWYGRRKESEPGVDDTTPATSLDTDAESDTGIHTVAALLYQAGVGEAPQGAQASAHEVHSAQANGHANGVPAGSKP